MRALTSLEDMAMSEVFLIGVTVGLTTIVLASAFAVGEAYGRRHAQEEHIIRLSVAIEELGDFVSILRAQEAIHSDYLNNGSLFSSARTPGTARTRTRTQHTQNTHHKTNNTHTQGKEG